MSFNNPTVNSYRDAFLLDSAYARRANDDWADGKPVFLGTFGWFGGGATVSTVDRIDFSNDSATAIARGPLVSARSALAAAGNSNYGWFGGGYSPGSISRVDRIDFANDISTASSRSPLNIARSVLSAVSNASLGWWSGGYTFTGINRSSIERIDFSNDLAIPSFRGPLSIARGRMGTASTVNYGWFGGGQIPGPTQYSIVDRIDFSNDSPTSATPRGPLTGVRFNFIATSNANYGWWGGGRIGSVTLSTVDRVDFSNDSATASTRGPLSSSRYNLGSVSSSNYGWFGGGFTTGAVATVDRVDFTNDSPTSALARGSLSTARAQLAGTSNYVKTIPSLRYPTQGLGSNEALTGYGWFGGGAGIGAPSPRSTVDRVDFSNDSVTASARSPVTGGQEAATGNANYGWWAGAFVTIVDRIDFSNDSPASASIRGPLSNGHNDGAATGNANYGWFGAGFNPSTGLPVRTIDRINFADDLVVSLARTTTLIDRNHVAATGNADYGWWAGGNISSVSSIERLTFSNDLLQPIIRGPLTSARYRLEGTGNANYGWFAGGLTPAPAAISTIDRIDFSNDSPTSASPRGPLILIKYAVSGASNSRYGWFAGGLTPAPAQVTTVERIDFANDSPTSASPRGPTTLARFDMGGTSNYVKPSANQFNLQRPFVGNIVDGTAGWFGGGGLFPFAVTSTVQKIDFANDSPTSASVRSPLSLARERSSGTGNQNSGLWGGGFSPTSVVDRIDFANDSPASASVRGPLTIARAGPAATGNANYGWWGGGGSGPLFSTVDRVDFANDSATASIRGPLSETKNMGAATGNVYYGWWGNATNPPVSQVSSRIERIDFANDSPTSASVRGPSANPKRSVAAVSNSNYGWWAGGYSPGFVRSWIERIDFSNDSPTSASPRGPLSIANFQFSGSASSNYGWFAGGNGPISTVNRIDFASDNVTASVRGTLAAARGYLAGLSNYVKTVPIFNVTQYAKSVNPVGTGVGTYGWTGGGDAGPVVSIVSRIDFSNDSPTSASNRGPLSSSRSAPGATGNADYGWWAGGFGMTSNIDRVDFANDSPTTAIVRCILNFARQNISAVSNSNFGWFTGGANAFAPFTVSVIERIDFSNDALNARVRSTFAASRDSCSASSNASYGWIIRGFEGGVSVSKVERIDFSNDIDKPLVRGPVSITASFAAATGNSNYGWTAGGNNPAITAVYRIDYANDGVTTTVRGPLSSARYGISAAANNNYGWFIGGGIPAAPQSSLIDRIDFANDTATASIRGPLPATRRNSAATSNYTK